MKEAAIQSVGIEENLKLRSDISWEHLDRFKYPVKIKIGCFLIVTEGQAELDYNLFSFTVKRNNIITITPGSIIQIKKYSHDFKATAIAFSVEFIREIRVLQATMPHLIYIRNNPVLCVEEEDAALITEFYAFFSKLHIRLEESSADIDNHIVRNMLMSFLYCIISIYERNSKRNEPAVLNRSREITWDLISLIMRYYKEERSVGFYADKLFITPKYLSDIVKKNTGNSVMELIAKVVILDAKTQLKSTTLTIQQICDSLNFPNPSFFGKYFKQHTGLSPKAYRESTI